MKSDGLRGRPIVYPGPIRTVALVAWLIALVVAFASAAANPVIGAVDAGQYGASTTQFIECFADLRGDRPECSYVKPALGGVTFPTVIARRDPGRLAADALSAGDAELIGTADRLISTQRDGVWPYLDRVKLRDSTLEAPWISASAQGLGISVLARAWTLTSDPVYRDALLAAAEAMPMAPDGWPETLPDGSHVLAGGLNGVLGLWDAWRVTRDLEIRSRFDHAVSWLEANIHRYDRDSIVLYALGPHADPTSAHLLRYSTAQLSVVAAASGRDVLAAIAREWHWRASNPGAFRLNLFLQAFAGEPATWLVAAFTVILVSPWGRRHLRVMAASR